MNLGLDELGRSATGAGGFASAEPIAAMDWRVAALDRVQPGLAARLAPTVDITDAAAVVVVLAALERLWRIWSARRWPTSRFLVGEDPEGYVAARRRRRGLDNQARPVATGCNPGIKLSATEPTSRQPEPL